MVTNPPITTARWLEIVKYELDRIADRAYQEKAWFNSSSKGPMSSPTEAIAVLIDSYGFEKGSQAPYLEISDTQRAACLRFARLLKMYSGNNRDLDPRVVINDPEWDKIRVAAQGLLKELFP